MKFGSILPWERDADIAFSSAHLQKLEQREAQWAQQGLRWALGKVNSVWCDCGPMPAYELYTIWFAGK